MNNLDMGSVVRGNIRKNNPNNARKLWINNLEIKEWLLDTGRRVSCKWCEIDLQPNVLSLLRHSRTKRHKDYVQSNVECETFENQDYSQNNNEKNLPTVSLKTINLSEKKHLYHTRLKRTVECNKELQLNESLKQSKSTTPSTSDEFFENNYTAEEFEKLNYLMTHSDNFEKIVESRPDNLFLENNYLEDEVELDNSCALETEIYKENDKVRKPLNITDDKGLFETVKKDNVMKMICSICGTLFSTMSSLNRHIKFVHQRKRIYCEICGKALSGTSTLREHMSIHSNEKPFKCKTCKKKFRLKSLLNQHMKTHKTWCCELCNETFLHKSKLMVHYNNHRKMSITYGCKSCHLVFESQKLLIEHNTNDHNRIINLLSPEQAIIDLCSNNSKSANSVQLDNDQIDKIIEKDIKNLKCSKCNKSFLTKQGLKRHNMREHENVEIPIFNCVICYKTLRTNAALKKHMTLHSDDKPYSCNICGKDYRLENLLKQHIQSHLIQSPFCCELCNQSFYHKQELLKHLYENHQTPNTSESRHNKGTDNYDKKKLTTDIFEDSVEIAENASSGYASDETKSKVSVNDESMTNNLNIEKTILNLNNIIIKCPICGKLYQSKSSLYSHKKSAHGDKTFPFECTICGKQLKFSISLKHHMRIHTGEKPFKCGSCDKSYRHRSTLYKHIRTHKIKYINK